MFFLSDFLRRQVFHAKLLVRLCHLSLQHLNFFLINIYFYNFIKSFPRLFATRHQNKLNTNIILVENRVKWNGRVSSPVSYSMIGLEDKAQIQTFPHIKTRRRRDVSCCMLDIISLILWWWMKPAARRNKDGKKTLREKLRYKLVEHLFNL